MCMSDASKAALRRACWGLRRAESWLGAPLGPRHYTALLGTAGRLFWAGFRPLFRTARLPNIWRSCPQALQNPEHDASHADAWCCGAIMYMLLAGAFPFLTAREAELGPMRQLHSLVQRIVSGRYLDLARSVSIPGLRVQVTSAHVAAEHCQRPLCTPRVLAALATRRLHQQTRDSLELPRVCTAHTSDCCMLLR
jgi:hypothetical protein